MEKKSEKTVRKKILFICTGNTCRSPMAEAALRKELKRRKITGYSVSSAGLRVDSDLINPNSAQALREAGISVLKSFKPRQATKKMIAEAEVVVCMTLSQERALANLGNVTSFPSLGGFEIPDPFGRDIDCYRTTLRRIREVLPLVIERYCPPLPKAEMQTTEFNRSKGGK